MGATTNKVRARQIADEGGWQALHMPLAIGRCFQVWLKNPASLPGLAVTAVGRFCSVRAVEPIDCWRVGVVLLELPRGVYQVRVCASGECVLLREHKAQAAGKGGG